MIGAILEIEEFQAASEDANVEILAERQAILLRVGPEAPEPKDDRDGQEDVGRGREGGQFRGGEGASSVVARWGARWNAAGWVWHGHERRTEPREGKCSALAEIDGGLMQWETADSRPQIEGIALAVAGEALIDLPIDFDREVRGGS